MISLKRYIAWYEKDGDKLVGQINLPATFLLEDIQKLFSVPKDNPMYDCWDVNEDHVSEIQNHIDITFEFDKYEYFIECSVLNN